MLRQPALGGGLELQRVSVVWIERKDVLGERLDQWPIARCQGLVGFLQQTRDVALGPLLGIPCSPMREGRGVAVRPRSSRP